MAASAAMARRCGCGVSELAGVPDEHPAWDAAAHYIAALCATLTLAGEGALHSFPLFCSASATLEHL